VLCEQCRTELEPVMVVCPSCGASVANRGSGGDPDWRRQVKETVERHKAKRKRESSKHEEDARQLTIFPETNDEDEQEAAVRKRNQEIRARLEERLKKPTSPAAQSRTSGEGVATSTAAATASALPSMTAEPMLDLGEAATEDPGGQAELAWTPDGADEVAEAATGESEEAATIGFGLASPGERLASGLIDVAFVSLIQLTLFYLTTHLVARRLDALPTSALVATGVVGTVLGALYFLFFWGLSGQTLGKLLTGSRVVDASGDGALGLSRAFLRLVAAFVSVLPIGAGLLGWWTDPERRGWHDRIASTHVVRG